MIWGEDEEKLFEFRKSVYPEFSFAQGAEKNPFALNSFVAKKRPFYDVEAAV